MFKKYLLFITCVLIQGAEVASCSVLDRKIYVSSSIGKETYDGHDKDHPTNDLQKALAEADEILLKAGDVFYTRTVDAKGKDISRYGEGENPILCGYKRIVTPRWEVVGNNVWRILLSDDNYSGVVVKGSSLSNNIGCIHEYDKDLIHGRKVQFKKELKEDWDIWQTERHDKEIPASEFDWLYLYYTGNPNELKLEFSTYETALQVENSTIDGIDIVGHGFGVAGGSKSIIRNCRIDAIGGRIFIGAKEYICYGNGIEFYINRNIQDCLVENCTISRCYDCAVTIQGSNSGQATPSNIIFRNNVIYDCCQAWEDFLRNDENVVYENCIFENNTILNSGNTSGFGYPESRFKYCHVLGNNSLGDKGMVIRNNTFIGGNWHCGNPYKGKYKSNVWEGNTCVIKRGDYLLGDYFGTSDVIRIPVEKGKFRSLKVATEDAIRRYRGMTGDSTTVFYIQSEKKVKARADKLEKKYLKKHKY